MPSRRNSSPSSTTLSRSALADASMIPTSSVGSLTAHLAGDRAEVVIAQLDGDGPRARGRRLGAARATPRAMCDNSSRELGPSGRSRGNVFSAPTDLRSCSVITSRSSWPFAISHSSRPREPNRASSRSTGACARSPTVRNPASASAFSELGPIPQSARVGSGARNAASVPGGTTTSPSGFFASDAILATVLFVPTPIETVRPVSLFTSLLQVARQARSRRRIRSWRPVTSRNASSSDSGSTSGVTERKMRHHLLRDLVVALEARRDADRVRAEPQRPRHRHRGAHTELPRFVRGRRDDAAALRRATHHDGLAPQLRVVQLFDRGVERIEVGVDDRAAHRKHDTELLPNDSTHCHRAFRQCYTGNAQHD